MRNVSSKVANCKLLHFIPTFSITTILILFLSLVIHSVTLGQSLTGVRLAGGITAERYPTSVGVRTLMINNEKNITFKIKSTSSTTINRSFKLYMMPLPSGTPMIVWSGVLTFTPNQTLSLDRTTNTELGTVVTQNIGSYRLELRGSNSSDINTVTPTSPLVSPVTGYNPISIKIISDAPQLTLLTETIGTAAVRYPVSIGALKLQTQKEKNISFSIRNLSSGAISRALKLYIVPQPSGTPVVVWEGVINFAGNQTLSFNRFNYADLGTIVTEGPGFYKLEIRGSDVPDLTTVTPTSPLVPVTTTARNPVTIEIVECPDDYLAISPADPITVCDNGTVDLSVIYSPNFTYQWRFNGVDIPGANTNIYTASVSGSYDLVTAKIGCPSFTSPAVNVTVYAPIIATITGLAAQYSNQDPAVTLSGTPAGGFFTGPGISGNQFDPGTAGPGTHTIIYSGNYLGCDYATTQQVIVIDCPASISITPSGSLVNCDNTPQIFTATNDPTYTYQWQKDNIDIPGANFDSYTATVSGNYQVIVSKAGCATLTSNTTNLIIVPVLTPAISGLAAQYSNQDPSVTLSGTPAGGTFSGPGMSGNQFSPNIAGPGTHVITYSGDISGCPYTISQSVTVVDCPSNITITPSGNITNCNNTPQNFTTVNDPTYTYQWQKDNTDIPGANSDSYLATVSGSYKVIVSKSGCANVISNVSVLTIVPVINPTISGLAPQYSNQAPPVNLTGTPAGGTFTGPGISGNQFFPGIAGVGTHAITYSGDVNGCPYSITRNVTVIDCPASITVSPSGPLTLCNNGTQLLTASTGVGYVYQWQRNNMNIFGANNDTYMVGGNFSGNYRVIVSKIGCSSVISNVVNITFNPPIVASITGLNNTYSISDLPVTMTGSPAGGTFTGPGVSGNQFDPSIAGIGNHVITYSGTFNGCPYSVNKNVRVQSCPNSITITADGPIRVCYGQDVTLSTPFDPTFSYQWQKDNVDIPGANSNAYVVTESGGYKLIASKPGCPTLTSNAIDIVVEDQIFVSINVDPIFYVTDPAFIMTATPPGGIFSGNGVVGNSFIPSVAGVGVHTIYYSGNFNGCPFIDSVSVEVLPAGCTELKYWSDNLNLGGQFFSIIDFDNDGMNDLVTQKVNPGRLNFYRNNGGGFDPPISMVVLPFPKTELPFTGHSENSKLFHTDFDGDGIKDLLITFSNVGMNGCSNDVVRIYWGVAFPPYYNAASFTNLNIGGNSCVNAYAIDFDSDGDKDVFIESAVNEMMYRNDGAHVFTSVTTVSTSLGIDFSVHDWNMDGIEDLLGVDYGNIDNIWGVSYYSGIGNGNFNPSLNYYVGVGGIWARKPHLHLQADININPNLDFAFNAMNDGTNGKRLYIGTWAGSNFTFTTQNTLHDRAQLTNILDWNRDGFDDIIYYVQNHNFSNRNYLFAQLSDGNGGFNRVVTIISGGTTMKFFGAFDMQGDCYKILGQDTDSMYVYNADENNPLYVRESAVLHTEIDSEQFTVYPNPTRGDLSIDFESKEDALTQIKIIDALGRLVKTEDFFAKTGPNKINLNLSGYSAGIYVLYVNCGGLRRTVKVAVSD